MKKIPLHIIIFFYLSLVPVIVFVIFLIIGMIYGDVNEVMGAIFLVVPVIACLKRGINPDILFVLVFFILVFQVVSVGNFIHARRKVREYKENHADDEK